MPVAMEAVPFLAALGAAGVILGWLFGPAGALPPFFLALFVLYFFRDPERVPPPGEGLVVAPADGRVMAVEPAAGGTRIAIFLSVFDCHINRAPVAGVVTEVRYARGRYRPAYDRRAGSENERNDLVIHSEIGRFGVTQIAGLLARRIVCRKGPGDRVERGERIGMIRFGSRTDLLLPAGIAPRVAPGDRVRGGLTIMAEAQAAGALAAGGIRG